MCSLAPRSNCRSVPKIGICRRGPSESSTRLYTICRMILRVHMLGYNPFLFEDTNWGKDFFAPLRNPTAVYMTFFPNNETQILFPDFDDTPPILYHGLKLTNIDLLFTLPWLNINNPDINKHSTLCVYWLIYMRCNVNLWTWLIGWTQRTGLWCLLISIYCRYVVFIHYYCA